MAWSYREDPRQRELRGAHDNWGAFRTSRLRGARVSIQRASVTRTTHAANGGTRTEGLALNCLKTRCVRGSRCPSQDHIFVLHTYPTLLELTVAGVIINGILHFSLTK